MSRSKTDPIASLDPIHLPFAFYSEEILQHPSVGTRFGLVFDQSGCIVATFALCHLYVTLTLS